jgi:hypothetical protein
MLLEVPDGQTPDLAKVIEELRGQNVTAMRAFRLLRESETFGSEDIWNVIIAFINGGYSEEHILGAILQDEEVNEELEPYIRKEPGSKIFPTIVPSAEIFADPFAQEFFFKICVAEDLDAELVDDFLDTRRVPFRVRHDFVHRYMYR